MTAVDPGMAQVVNMDWKEGSQAVFTQLGDDGVFVDDSFADDHDLELGSTWSSRSRTVRARASS